jgi:hypothetical protein
VEEGSGAEDVDGSDTGGVEGGPYLKSVGVTSEYEAVGRGAEIGALSKGAGGGRVVVGASVGAGAGAGAGGAKKEDGSGDGRAGATDWDDGVATAGVSETVGLEIGDSVEIATLAVRVSMLTVLPASSTQTTTSGAVTVTYSVTSARGCMWRWP